MVAVIVVAIGVEIGAVIVVGVTGAPAVAVDIFGVRKVVELVLKTVAGVVLLFIVRKVVVMPEEVKRRGAVVVMLVGALIYKLIAAVASVPVLPARPEVSFEEEVDFVVILRNVEVVPAVAVGFTDANTVAAITVVAVVTVVTVSLPVIIVALVAAVVP